MVSELMRRRALLMAKQSPYDAEVEYLQGNGAQYIDTGIVPDADTGLEVVGFGVNTDNFMAGLKDTARGNTRWAIGNTGNNKYYYGYGGSSSAVSLEENVVAMVKLNYLNSKYFEVSKADGSTPSSRSLPTLGFVPQNQIRLFGSSGVVASYTTWAGKIYGAKISQGSDVVMDLIPVRKGTTGYMYDRVSGQLFGNDGTGSFILGNDINT